MVKDIQEITVDSLFLSNTIISVINDKIEKLIKKSVINND